MKVRALLVTLGLLVATASAAAAGPRSPAPAPPVRTGSASHGLTLTGFRNLSPRLSELTFATRHVVGPTRVRVLTPQGMDRTGRTRYPVLWLLHGAGMDATWWTVEGDAEKLTAKYPFIVVMPETSPGDGYIDWYNSGTYGPPRWESYHIGQLLPWVDAHYPTKATRSARAVAGLSMGGAGTMIYAARHPDLFAAAEAFSGAVDVTNTYLRGVTLREQYDPRGNGFGPYETNEGYYRAHNPVDLAGNLRGVFLALRTGDGIPSSTCPSCADPVEVDVHQMNVAFHEELERQGVAHVWDDYGDGTHTAPYWQRSLAVALQDVERVFAHPSPAPATVDHKAWNPSYSVFGWSVAVRRPNREFSQLSRAGRTGFALTGSGTATVTTAALFRPGSKLSIDIQTETAHLRELGTADRHGRLTLRVPLGPTNSADQYSPEAHAHDAAYAAEQTLGTFQAVKQPAVVAHTTQVTFGPTVG